jgi:parallel beta-helix repeat protein
MKRIKLLLAFVCSLGFILILVAGLRITSAAPNGLLFVTSGGSGTTCSQSAPCQLQTALNQAIPGDTIYVAAGAYTGSGTAVVAITQSLTLYGGWNGDPTGPIVRDSDEFETVLNGQDQRRVISITKPGVAAVAVTIDGFTIRGGDATGLGGSIVGYDMGAGVYGHYADVTVSDCLIKDNVASTANIGWGGGLGFYGGSNTLEGSVVENNIASTASSGYGGGVFFRHGSSTISGTTVQSNTGSTIGNGYGGGIAFMFTSGNAQGNDVLENIGSTGVIVNAANGGGVYVRGGGGVSFVDNVIRGNIAATASVPAYGGGMYVYDSTVNLDGDEITGNTAQLPMVAGYGGGFSANYTSTVTMVGVDIWGNAAIFGAGAHFDSSPGVVLTGTQVFSNAGSWVGGLNFVGSPNAVLTANHIYSNTAGYAAGILLQNSGGSRLVNNHVYTNTSEGLAGGMWIYGSNDTTLLGNHIYQNAASSDGGGVYVMLSSNVVLSDNHIYSNTASLSSPLLHGAGVLVDGSFGATLENNEIYGNRALYGAGARFDSSGGATIVGNEFHHNNSVSDNGAGVYMSSSPTPTLSGNEFHHNVAPGGPAMFLWGTDGAVLIRNDIHHNEGDQGSGGISLYDINGVLVGGNRISENVGDGEGGMYVSSSSHVLITGNTFYSNTASMTGGGIAVRNSSHVTLTANSFLRNSVVSGEGGGLNLGSNPGSILLINNILADNQGSSGAGVIVSDSPVEMVHTTLARNSGGSGIHVVSGGQVTLTNTILVSHTIGIVVSASSTATLEATLWGDGKWGNGIDWDGTGEIVTGSINLWELPGFLGPDQGVYHISAGSAAVDAGVGVPVFVDIDGDTRPRGMANDLGADEAYPAAYLPLVMRNS